LFRICHSRTPAIHAIGARLGFVKIVGFELSWALVVVVRIQTPWQHVISFISAIETFEWVLFSLEEVSILEKEAELAYLALWHHLIDVVRATLLHYDFDIAVDGFFEWRDHVRCRTGLSRVLSLEECSMV
jgi:hypothetical protein